MLTLDFIRQYLVKDPPKHRFYPESIKIKEALEVHADGTIPSDLLKIARPNEDEKYLKYREDVYKPITKTYFSKVCTTIGKISRAEDWSIKFPDAKIFEIKTYTQEEFPYFDSLENWFFSIGLGEMLEDPNGVYAVLPLDKLNPADDTELYRPFVRIFCSDDVIDYKEGKYAVLMDEEKSPVKIGDNTVMEGNIIHVLDEVNYYKFIQVGQKDKYEFTENVITHNFGHVPAFKAGGVPEEFSNGDTLYDSFIGDCIPYWDEAIRRYSDHQVNMVIHLHPREWEIMDTECGTCRGQGTVLGKDDQRHKCGTCGGGGMISMKSPFGVKQIKVATKQGASEATPAPTPPAGIIQRDVAAIAFLKDEYKSNLRDGLAAINMEFLMNEPMINSGIAKSMDRQEMNTYFYNIGRHIVKNILDVSYYFIARWRSFGKDEEFALKAMPLISVPTKFDILTSDVLAARLENIKNLPPAAAAALQLEYSKQEFGDESETYFVQKTISELDPLPGKTEDEKMVILSNGGTTDEKYILSSNITAFVHRAINEDQKFIDKNYIQKLDQLNKYVAEIIKSKTSGLMPTMDGGINTPVDVEAEAKANLKGSVGGVQGILQIQASVAAGVTERSAAISLLQEIYGFDPSISEKMLGDPKKVTPIVNAA